MGPVEAILMGLRPVLRPRGRLPESLCRTLDDQGRERSSCVRCHSPCLDIDANKSYRTSLLEERGLGAAWWSYPGLVLAFFLLLDRTSSSLNGVRHASWASAGATALCTLRQGWQMEWQRRRDAWMKVATTAVMGWR